MRQVMLLSIDFVVGLFFVSVALIVTVEHKDDLKQTSPRWLPDGGIFTICSVTVTNPVQVRRTSWIELPSKVDLYFLQKLCLIILCRVWP